MTVIEGQFRNLKRRRKKRPVAMGALQYDEMGNVIGDDGSEPPVGNQNTQSLGAQYWEYTHQGEVQTENVILTGTNNPHAMDDNPFYQAEQGVRDTIDSLANSAQNLLSGSTKWLLIAAVAYFVVLPMIEKGGE